MAKKNDKIHTGEHGVPNLEIARADREYKFGAKQGHGNAAEEANVLIEKLKGKDAKVVGGNNAKDGPDTLVNGEFRQLKYYKTSGESVNGAFDKKTKLYRYGQMKLEVPFDQYDKAVEKFADKISNGQVPGETNPDNAKNYVSKGNLTYQQAKNIAKAGNIDSITYDFANGIITSISSVGISASIAIAQAVWNKTPVDKAIKQIVPSLLKTFAKTVTITTVSGQILKSPLRKMVSNFLVEKVGVKLLTKTGKEMSKKAAKGILTKTAAVPIVNVVTFVVLSAGDIRRAFTGRISLKQMTKNMVITGVGMGGGGVAAAAITPVAAAAGPFAPVVFLAAAVAGGVISSAAASKLLSGIKNDAEEMQEILEEAFKALAFDYMITETEVDNIVKGIAEKIDDKFLKDMYQASNRISFAREFLEPYFEIELTNRPPVEILKKLNRLNKKRFYMKFIILTMLFIIIYYKLDVIISLYTQFSN